jgi:hypothetical protein
MPASRGLFQRVYSPVHHAIQAAENVISTGLGAVDKMGRNVTRHANMAITEPFSRSRKGGARKSSRKATRKATRKNRRKASHRK